MELVLERLLFPLKKEDYPIDLHPKGKKFNDGHPKGKAVLRKRCQERQTAERQNFRLTLDFGKLIPAL